MAATHRHISVLAEQVLSAAVNSVEMPAGYHLHVVGAFLRIEIHGGMGSNPQWDAAWIMWNWDLSEDKPIFRCNLTQGQTLSKTGPDLNELVQWACVTDRLNIGK